MSRAAGSGFPRGGFWRDAAIGFAATAAAAALVAALGPLVGAASALRLVIPALGLVCVLDRLATSRERTGRIVVAIGWLAAAVAIWLVVPGVAGTVLAHAALVWLVRALYRYSSLLSAAADLGLTAVAVAVAAWVYGFSGSLFLAGWCFFLTQALNASIPETLGRAEPPAADASRDAFESAHRAATAALRRLGAAR